MSDERFSVNIDDDNIIHLGLHGIVGEEDIEEFKSWADIVRQTVVDVRNNSGDKVRCIVNIDGLAGYSVEAFDIVRDLVKKNKGDVRKTATYGGNKFVQFAQDAMAILSDRENIKAFDTKEEAMSWLLAESE